MTTPYQPPPRDDAASRAPVRLATQMIVPDDSVPPTQGVTAFMSTQVRAGDWILPRLFRTVSFFGNVTIDLTSARFGEGRSQIEVVAIMASITVLVPPDVRVECDGDAIVGSFDLQGQKWSTPAPGAPTIHITGTAYLGSVEVKIENPNAPSWLKTLRARWNEVRGIGSGQP